MGISLQSWDNFVKHGAWLETSVSESYTLLADDVG